MDMIHRYDKLSFFFQVTTYLIYVLFLRVVLSGSYSVFELRRKIE